MDRQTVATITRQSGQFKRESRFVPHRRRSMFTAAGLGGTRTARGSRLRQRRGRRGRQLLRAVQAQRSVGADATRSNTAGDHRQEHQSPRHDDARRLWNSKHYFNLSWQFIPPFGCGSHGKVTPVVNEKLGQFWHSLFFRAGWRAAGPLRTGWQGSLSIASRRGESVCSSWTRGTNRFRTDPNPVTLGE